MEKKKKTLKNILFQSNARIVIILILLLFASTSVYIVNDRISRLTELQTNLCSSVLSSLESSVDTMSTVSMNVLYSPVIRRELKKADPEHSNIKTMEPVYDAIALAIGPYRNVTQVIFHSEKDLQAGWGIYELYAVIDYDSMKDYQVIREKHGAKYFSKPDVRDDMAYYNYNYREKKFLSLYRMYYGEAYEENGIVEVIQECDKFYKDINEIKTQNSTLEICIYNQDNQIIYPYESEETEAAELSEEILEQLASGSKATIAQDGSFVSCGVLEDLDWKVVIRQDKSIVLKPIIMFLMIYSMIGISFLGVMVYVCYKMARKVSMPMFNLMERMENLDLINTIENNVRMEPVNYSIEELNVLSEVFETMYLRLENSTRELMSVKIEEIRAKMIAIQSMIEPHFIYNNLANISIMAEEQMTGEISELCKNLCDYLRYISADSLTTVDVLTEMYYSEKYLDCMKIRYGSRLTYSFDIPAEMEKVKISKLTFQPLIENALKYAFREDPPWTLQITGRINEQGWEISVIDNGVGIHEEYLKEIRANQERIRRTKDISTMQIGGMGLANVYLRLILLHDEQAKLVFECPESGGTKVTISRLHRTKPD